MFCQSVSNPCLTLFWQKVLHNLGESLGALHGAFSLVRTAQLGRAISSCTKQFLSADHPKHLCGIGNQLVKICGSWVTKMGRKRMKFYETCVEFCGFWDSHDMCFLSILVKLRTGSHASMQMILQEPQQSICKTTPQDLKALKGSWMAKTKHRFMIRYFSESKTSYYFMVCLIEVNVVPSMKILEF